MNHQTFIYIFIIPLILAVIFATYLICIKSSNQARDTITKPFNQTIPNNNMIIIEGWNYNELQKILSDFQNMYKNNGYPDYTISTTEISHNKFELSFPQDIHPLLFTLLINYLAYPIGFETQHKTVAGTITLTSDFAGVPPELFGEKAILYIPQDDQQHDAVFMHTQSGKNLYNSLERCVWNETIHYDPNEIVLALQNK